MTAAATQLVCAKVVGVGRKGNVGVGGNQDARWNKDFAVATVEILNIILNAVLGRSATRKISSSHFTLIDGATTIYSSTRETRPAMENQSISSSSDHATSSWDVHVEEHVKSRLNGRVKDFRVTFESEGLVLSGRCRTYHAKQLAQHLVMETSDVRILANLIEVVSRDEA